MCIRDRVIALLKMTAKKYGQTIVMITHDDEIAQVADRILVIEDGHCLLYTSYASLIIKGVKTLDDVPDKLKEAVKAILQGDN